MKKIGAVLLIVGLVALGFGIYGFIKVASSGIPVDQIAAFLQEIGANISGVEDFAILNRVWLTIAGGVAALAGAVMAFKKES